MFNLLKKHSNKKMNEALKQKNTTIEKKENTTIENYYLYLAKGLVDEKIKNNEVVYTEIKPKKIENNLFYIKASIIIYGKEFYSFCSSYCEFNKNLPFIVRDVAEYLKHTSPIPASINNKNKSDCKRIAQVLFNIKKDYKYCIDATNNEHSIRVSYFGICFLAIGKTKKEVENSIVSQLLKFIETCDEIKDKAILIISEYLESISIETHPAGSDTCNFHINSIWFWSRRQNAWSDHSDSYFKTIEIQNYINENSDAFEKLGLI